MLNVRGVSSWNWAAALALGFAGLMGGCDGTAGAPGQGTSGAPEQGTAEPGATSSAAPAPAKLTIAQDDEQIISGTANDGVSTVSFEGRALGGAKYDITLRLNGAVLTAMGDAEGRFHTLDGFAAGNGQDTQLDATDVAALRAFKLGLSQYNFDHGGGTFIARQTQSMAGVFQMYATSTLPLQGEITGNNDHLQTYICGNYLKWTPATHDCDHNGDWGPGNWGFLSVGERWFQSGGTATREYFADEPWWHNATYPHKGGQYLSGNCLGQCGGDCQAGDQYLTSACLAHDQCTSGNHPGGGTWCTDELIPAAADAAAPHVNCAGTASDPPDAVTWQNTNFPNNGAERKLGAHGICYQIHIADFGWTQVFCDDSMAGSTGLSKMGQAIRIWSQVPGISVCYTGTMAGIAAPMTGCDGQMVGTTGQSRRLETLRIYSPNSSAILRYQVHIDSTGWLGYVSTNATTGSAGKSIQATKVKMCAHDVCTTGPNLVAPSCDDTCVATVCAQDSWCCNNSWDSICKGEVTQFCGRTCP